MVSQEDVFKLVYNAATCFIPTNSPIVESVLCSNSSKLDEFSFVPRVAIQTLNTAC